MGATVCRWGLTCALRVLIMGVQNIVTSVIAGLLVALKGVETLPSPNPWNRLPVSVVPVELFISNTECSSGSRLAYAELQSVSN